MRDLHTFATQKAYPFTARKSANLRVAQNHPAKYHGFTSLTLQGLWDGLLHGSTRENESRKNRGQALT